MRTTHTSLSHACGFSLVENIIAMGVLAVAFPLVLAALAESGRSNVSAEADSRSTWIVPICLEEIRASRRGKPTYFPATAAGQAIPESGGIWALGFSSNGKPIGKITRSAYEQGVRQLNGVPTQYIARIQAVKQTPNGSATAAASASELLHAQIVMEFPATVPADKRQKIEFHTLVP